MKFLPDTNACIAMLRQRNPELIARWQATKSSDVVLCSVVTFKRATPCLPECARYLYKVPPGRRDLLSACIETSEARRWAIK